MTKADFVALKHAVEELHDTVEEPGSGQRFTYAVLQYAPIQSARDAVRASLALRHRATNRA